MVAAAAALNPRQRGTALVMAAEIMRSDGDLLDDERNVHHPAGDGWAPRRSAVARWRL